MANGNGDAIRQWWPIIVVTAAGLISWGTLQSQVSEAQQDIKKLQTDNKSHDQKETTDTIKIEVLATKQATILEDVKEIKEEQKEQSEQLDRIESLLRARQD